MFKSNPKRDTNEENEEVPVRAFLMENLNRNLYPGFKEGLLPERIYRYVFNKVKAFHDVLENEFQIKPHMWEFYENTTLPPNQSGEINFSAKGLVLQKHPDHDLPVIRSYDPEFELKDLGSSLTVGSEFRHWFLGNDDMPAASMATGNYITPKQVDETEGILAYVNLKKSGQNSTAACRFLLNQRNPPSHRDKSPARL